MTWRFTHDINSGIIWPLIEVPADTVIWDSHQWAYMDGILHLDESHFIKLHRTAPDLIQEANNAASSPAGASNISDIPSIEANPGQSPLDLNHITSEASTNDDGYVPEALLSGPPSILGGNEGIVRAVDGLHWGPRDGLWVTWCSSALQCLDLRRLAKIGLQQWRNFRDSTSSHEGIFVGLGLSNSCAQKPQADAVIKELRARQNFVYFFNQHWHCGFTKAPFG
ncbi:hypothetical protein ARMSODRAFT_1006273 [Armillaria solidipes]|uniref:Uncharacterized protein n=1 Tax=Armillaria solidipes TaxID=1076256 RepID=A0A2H3BRQ4_9AGAR|nr:hypothetical protein ARMSODRAFT_1006273 [Armillaria solidipes]